MNRTKKTLIPSAVVVSIIVVTAVCWHSLQEIHYLKSFYPHQFTVQEAFYASAVELVKVLVITIPFLFAIIAGLLLLHSWKRTQ